MKTSTELSPTAEYASLAESVPPEWRLEFVSFVTSGSASEEFLTFLDADERAQQAVEAAVSEEVRNFNRFAQSLNIDPELIENYRQRKKRKPLEIARSAASKVIVGLLDIVSLKPRDRREAFHTAVVAIPAEQAADVAGILEELRDEVSVSVRSRHELAGARVELPRR
ncbi:MAG: hypothetical protein M3Q69_12420 [Acidobacteriota bacterium]|nr:hypothetical protein [Acidobacteriota bacterium]